MSFINCLKFDTTSTYNYIVLGDTFVSILSVVARDLNFKPPYSLICIYMYAQWCI